MKNKSILISLCIAVMFITACKKENVAPPFNPEGYWRGNAYLYHTAILNRQDGSSRLYFRIPGSDTAMAQLKTEGTYTITNGRFRAVYSINNPEDYLIESNKASEDNMSGLMIFSTGEAVSFDFKKQP